jgi:hypothetical protein
LQFPQIGYRKRTWMTVDAGRGNVPLKTGTTGAEQKVHTKGTIQKASTAPLIIIQSTSS